MSLKSKGESVTAAVRAFTQIVSWKLWEEVKVISYPVSVSLSSDEHPAVEESRCRLVIGQSLMSDLKIAELESWPVVTVYGD